MKPEQIRNGRPKIKQCIHDLKSGIIFLWTKNNCPQNEVLFPFSLSLGLGITGFVNTGHGFYPQIDSYLLRWVSAQTVNRNEPNNELSCVWIVIVSYWTVLSWWLLFACWVRWIRLIRKQCERLLARFCSQQALCKHSQAKLAIWRRHQQPH